MNQISRRTALTGAVPALALGVSGCSAAAALTRPEEPGSANIVVAVVSNPDMLRLEQLTSEFTAATGITVQYVTLAHSDLTAQVSQVAAAGTGEFDVAMVSPNEIQAGWAAQGYVQTLDEHFAGLSVEERAAYDVDDLLPKVRSALSVDDRLYALPFNAESSMLFYRKDLFSAVGLTMPDAPTWEDVRGFARALNSPGTRGLDLRFAPEAGELSPFMTVVNSFGGRWFDEAWNPQLLSEEFVAAAEFYVGVLREAGDPTQAVATFSSGLEAMQRGRSAMWLDSTVAGGLLSNPLISSVADTVGFVKAPTQGCSNGSAWLYSWALGLVKGSTKSDAAFRFMRWATSGEYLELVADTAGWASIPPGTRSSIYADQRYTSAAPFAQLTLDSIDGADPSSPSCLPVPYAGINVVYIPEFAEIATYVGGGLVGAVHGQTSVTEWLTDAQAHVVAAMTTAGYLN
jgi:sorbitol/mannitol transport system substrate-binding protein